MIFKRKITVGDIVCIMHQGCGYNFERQTVPWYIFNFEKSHFQAFAGRLERTVNKLSSKHKIQLTDMGQVKQTIGREELHLGTAFFHRFP